MIGKNLTKSCWLLTSDLGNHVALAFERAGVFVSSHNSEKAYNSLQDIAREFGEDYAEKKKKKEILKEVCGYPIKHEAAFEIQEEPYPTYKSKEGSNVRYAAGWWVLEFESGLKAAMSPKISTLNDKCQGPYKDKFTANVTIGISNG